MYIEVLKGKSLVGSYKKPRLEGASCENALQLPKNRETRSRASTAFLLCPAHVSPSNEDFEQTRALQSSVYDDFASAKTYMHRINGYLTFVILERLFAASSQASTVRPDVR